MFQSLISVCDFSQRFRILMKIKETIPILACQQQGTFVFQQYVNFLKDEDEFRILAKEVKKKFY